MYADDVVLFLCPTPADIDLTLKILQLFGDASGLHNNVQKSNVYHIRCSDEALLEVQTLMPCEISTFPCRYWGSLYPYTSCLGNSSNQLLIR
jgi:hypothetical protein